MSIGSFLTSFDISTAREFTPEDVRELESNNEHTDSRELFWPRYFGWDSEANDYYEYGEILDEGGVDWKYPVALYPPQRDARLSSQHGFFTIHGYDLRPMDAMFPSLIAAIDLKPNAVSEVTEALEYSGFNEFNVEIGSGGADVVATSGTQWPLTASVSHVACAHTDFACLAASAAATLARFRADGNCSMPSIFSASSGSAGASPAKVRVVGSQEPAGIGSFLYTIINYFGVTSTITYDISGS
jgi:hypothetical protein